MEKKEFIDKLLADYDLVETDKQCLNNISGALLDATNYKKPTTKEEAVKEFVKRDFQAIPLEWVQSIAEAKGEEIYTWPMWGTMWFVDNHIGEKLFQNSRLMEAEKENLKHVSFDSTEEEEKVLKAIEEDDWSVLQHYIDEEMAGSHCVLDKDGDTTAVYVYEIDGQYLIGVNGAGWDFYSGVWDMLYDLLGLKWHDEK